MKTSKITILLVGMMLAFVVSAFVIPQSEETAPTAYDLMAAVNAHRAANGYYALSPHNLVMASHHEYGHSVYLTNGVFSELTLVWSQGRFVRLPWTNPDFFDDEAVDLFERVRACFELVGDPV